jgi:RNA polymerase sigma-70 factor (ECF subfamily)
MITWMSNWNEVDDIQLLKVAQEGNTEAFGAIYERYADKVFRYLNAHLGNGLDAEDLTEEVFIRVWRSLPDYRERGTPFLSFVFRVARNALIDHYRRERRAVGQLSSDEVMVADSKPGPGEIVSQQMERQELKEALEGLREDYRNVVILRFLSELSPEDTAAVMGRSAGAVRVLQHRALAALRVRLEKLRGNRDGK